MTACKADDKELGNTVHWMPHSREMDGEQGPDPLGI